MATVTYYFDCSDAGPTDPGANWTNAANVFDSVPTTTATRTANGTESTNYLMGEGTNAPGTGGDILGVRTRAYNGVSFGSYNILTKPAAGWSWSLIQALEVRVWTVNDPPADIYFSVRTDGWAEALFTSAFAGVYTAVGIIEIEVTYVTTSVDFYLKQGFQ